MIEVILFFVIIIMWLYIEKKPARQLDNLTVNKWNIIYYYSPNCPHCNKFSPIWIKISKKYNKYFNFTTIDCSKTENAQLCSEAKKKYNLNGIPHIIKLKSDDSNIYKIFSGSRDYYTFLAWILEN
jgi:thiol-disulfide isomerase/thioredoxin